MPGPHPTTIAGQGAPAAGPFVIEVQLFASVREAVGRGHVAVTLPAGATTSALLDALAAAHPGVARQRRALAVAVNQVVVSRPTPLVAGDEVALLPPVGGG